MKLPVDLLQAFPCYMRIDLRCGDVCMTQHDLYGTQIGPSLEKVRGEGMAEGVRMNPLAKTCLRSILFYDLPESLPRYSIPRTVQK